MTAEYSVFPALITVPDGYILTATLPDDALLVLVQRLTPDLRSNIITSQSVSRPDLLLRQRSEYFFSCCPPSRLSNVFLLNLLTDGDGNKYSRSLDTSPASPVIATYLAQDRVTEVSTRKYLS